MPTPTFTLSFGSQQIAVSSLACNPTTFPEYTSVLHPGWTVTACSQNPLRVNTNLTVSKPGQANQVLNVTGISPIIPTSLPLPSVAQGSSFTHTVTVQIDATETIAIKQLLEPWLTPGFFNLVIAFMLLTMFWGGFASGSRTTGRGF